MDRKGVKMKRLVGLVLVGVLVCCAAYADRRQEVSVEHLEGARRYLATGMFKRAEQECRLALKLDEDSVLARQLLGEIEATAKMGRRERLARQELAAARQDYRCSRLAACREHLESVLLYAPADEGAVRLAAILKEEEVAFDEARPFAESAAHYYRSGMKDYRLGRYAPALELLVRADKIYAGDKRLRRLVDKCEAAYQEEARQERFAAALTAMEKHLAEFALEDAGQLLDSLQADYPGDARIIDWRQRVAASEGRQLNEQARAKQRQAVALGKRGEYSAALKLAEQAAAVLPGERDIEELVAKFKAACAELSEKKKQQADLARGKRLAAAAERSLADGDYAAAAVSLAALAKLDVLPARCDELRRQLAAAERQRSAAEKEKAEEHYRKGLAFYQLGKLEEARGEWRLVLQFDPGHKKAKKNLDKLGSE